MSSHTLALLLSILKATSPKEYLDAQDQALPSLTKQYEELLVNASEHPDPNVRAEALRLISLLDSPDAQDVLLARFKGDEDLGVSEVAKSLLFRAIVETNVRSSGKMSEEEHLTYKTNVRRMAAEAMFSPTDSTGPASS